MYTTDSVLDAFRRAVELAKRLPGGAPKGVSSPWPDILRLGSEGYSEKGMASPSLTGAEMKEYETTMSWLTFVKDETSRRVLLYYAAGVPGWKIAKGFHHPSISQSTVSRRILWALGFITFKLNAGEAPPPIEFHG